ncbi:hypothetical protein CLU79DRAFT_758880 [Phycomyces nitens]|nr:hypothetical protein CLU79DRAFT_758880 [Phycomyces nitens]
MCTSLWYKAFLMILSIFEAIESLIFNASSSCHLFIQPTAESSFLLYQYMFHRRFKKMCTVKPTQRKVSHGLHESTRMM